MNNDISKEQLVKICSIVYSQTRAPFNLAECEDFMQVEQMISSGMTLVDLFNYAETEDQGIIMLAYKNVVGDIETVSFDIQGKGKGFANIIEADAPIVATAIKMLTFAGISVKDKKVTAREIGTAKRGNTVYKIYGSYVDSGSDDYIYIATPSHQIEE